MEFIRALVSGIIGGFTCVSPVSWEGHLKLSEFLYFDVNKPYTDSILPLVIIFAVIISLVYFSKDNILYILKEIVEIFKDIKNKNFKLENGEKSRNDLFMIIFASVPFLLTPLFFFLFKGMANNLLMIALAFVISGLFMYFADGVRERRFAYKNENPFNAVSVGIFNLFSAMPGISGISGMYFSCMKNNFTKEFSLKFIYLLTIIYMFFSFIRKAIALTNGVVINFNIFSYILAFAGALVASYYAIKLVETAMKKSHLKYYGFYNIILAVFILLVWIRG